MKLFYIAYFLFIHPFKFESYLNSKYVGQYPFHWISSITLPRQNKIVCFWQHLSSWEYLWWKGNFHWHVACLPNFFTNQSHQSRHKKHGGTEEHSCTVLVCICCMVPWGTLSTMEAGKTDNSQARKQLLHRLFCFLGLLFGFSFVCFFFLVLKRYSLSIQVIPGLVFSPSCRPLINQTWLLTVAQLPSQEPGIQGPCLGRDLKLDGPMQETSKPLMSTVDECGALVMSLAARAPRTHSGIQCGVRDRTSQSFRPAWQGRGKKIKRKKVFGVRISL